MSLLARLRPRSLAAQLTLLLLAALVGAQAVSTVVFLQNRRSAIEVAVREQILGRTAALVRLLEDTPPTLHQRILETAGSPRLAYSIAAAPALTMNAPPRDEPELASLLAEAFGGREVRIAVGERDWRPRRFRDHDRGRVGNHAGEHAGNRAGPDGDDRPPPPPAPPPLRVATASLSVALGPGRWLNVEGQLPSPIFWAWPSMVSTAITAVAVLVAAGFAVRRITRPLRRLADAADRLGRGEDVPPLPEDGPEEARRTTHAFNAMQGRVRRFVADRTRMIAAMSHDLRTPLTSLRLRAEFVDDDETREKMIATIDEMSRMTEATLAFARDDARDEAARRTDVAALVRAIVDDFADMGADVVADGPDRLDMTVRPSALRRALRNLVENALRYGVRARVTLARGPRETVITVDDDGPGIPADRIDEVFEPFTRLETSRNAETGGVGLGLSTARSIVRAHGGEITLTNREGGGLTATVRLPV